MLHTLYSLSKLQAQSGLVLDQSYYNIFDSRNFKSDFNIEDTFHNIKEDFVRIWWNTIKPFLDAMMYNHNIYKVNPKKGLVLIPEEGIYLELQGLSSGNIEFFFATPNKALRLIGISTEDEENRNSSLSVFDSPVYDPLNKSYYYPITIVLYKKALLDYKDDPAALNRVLLRITNMLAISYIDNQLMTKHNVTVNRVLASNTIDSNKDVIILPESLNISDTRFIHAYFYTLFDILTTVLDSQYLYNFTDYSNIISLPDIFKFNMTDEEAVEAQVKLESMTDEEATLYSIGFKQKIYARIWEQARRKQDIYTEDYVTICADILRNLEINIDTMYYESQQDASEYSENSEEDNYQEDESEEENKED